MVDFKSIETFLWVVTLGSFRGAGQRLNTTQPAISQRIAQLEREMGVKLLNRDHRVASPTPSGRQLMVYAEKLIGLRSEMMAEVGDRSAMRGVLRLGVAETIVHTWLPRLIKSVNTAHPNLSLEIEVDITPKPERAAAGAGNRTRLCARAIVRLQRAQPRAVRLSRRLSGQPLARSRQRSVDGAVISRSFRSSPFRARPSLTRSCARCSTGPICRRSGCTPAPRSRPSIHMAIEGLGIAVIPTAIVENELADGRLAAAVDRSQNPAADIFGKLAGIARHARGRTRRRSRRQDRAGLRAAVIDAPLRARH